ncbi:MAG: GLPGLI family protein [Chitinophagaceae bacterium]
MKSTVLFALAIAFSNNMVAQVKEGTITYERKINTWRRITDEQMRAMIPEYRVSKHVLMFNDSTSVYKMLPEDEAPDPFAGGNGGGVRIAFRGSGADAGELYKNFANSTSIQSTELGGKNFLITDSIKKLPWKITSDTKQILGYTCRKAVRKMQAPAGPISITRITTRTDGGNAQSDTAKTVNPTPKMKDIEVVAWFAENLPVPVGPDANTSLPGAVLEVDIDNGGTVFVATEVKKTVDANALKEPKKGKKITAADYQKMMIEMMQNQIPSGGGMRFSM